MSDVMRILSALDEALARRERKERREAEPVKLRCFAGLTTDQTDARTA